jgi:spermidine synthase
VAFFSGFYVMTLENVLIRIANFSLGSSSYSFSLIVSVFILSIAAGSYVIGRFKTIHSRLLFNNQLFITLSLLLVYFSLDTWPYFAHLIRATFSKPGLFAFAGFYIYAFVAFVLILILPLGLMGATVPIAFHEIKRDLRTVGKYSGILFSVNTLGNLTGSLIGGIFFYYFLNNPGVFLSAIILSSLSVLLCARYLSKSYFWLSALLTASICLFSMVNPGYNEKNFTIGTFYQRGFLPYSLSGPGEFFRQWNKGRELKFYKDGPTATVAVTEHDYPPDAPNAEKSLSIVVNGKSDSSTIGDAYTIKLLAHIPALLAEKRENVMVVGLGTGVTAGELTLYPDVKTVDVAEISPFVIEALPYFETFNHNLNDHPGVNIHMGDAFRILGRSMKKWDIIISEPSNPWVTGVDLLFTREFYQLAKAHMTENGILAQWAHTYASSVSMLGMIINTMQQEFKYIRVFMATAGDLVITASNKEFSVRDMENAETVIRENEQVKNSLGAIHLNTAESVFIREIWTPSYLSDNFSGFGIQTMDHPRLHYMAGKSFFAGERISNHRLFNSASAEYTNDFLITQKNENRPFSKARTDQLIFSLKDKYLGYYLPMAQALRLKAYLSHPEEYPLPQDEKNAYQTDLIPFITDFPEDEADWEKVTLSRASFREKAAALLEHIRRFRNWIVPYSLDGLKKLLQKGIAQGADPYEKNWCSMQLVLLLSAEHADPEAIKAVMDKMIKKADGEIIVRERDQNLLAKAREICRKSGCQ